ncbi:MAG: ABC transporter ATP-binding protein [Proteobacteria bacterium]|nr:ABC transporter ATP-binding protein [Pseudomonadota bacterium]
MSAPAIAVGARPGERGPIAHALRRLWGYIRRNRAFYAVCVGLILAYNAAFVAVPILVGRVVAAAETGLPREVVGNRSLVLLAVVIFGAAVRYFSRTMVFNAAREVEYEIRNDLFAQLQRLPQSFYFQWRTGDLMSRCVNDLNSVRLLLGIGILNVIQTPIMFLGVFAVMFTLNPQLTLLVLSPYPLFVVIARVFGRQMYGRSMAVQVGLADLSNQLQESVAGIAVVKAYAMEERQRRVFGQANQALWARHLGLVRVMAAMPAITGMLPAVAMGMVLGFGGPLIQGGQMTLAVFFTFAMYIYQLTFPTFLMGWVFAIVQRGAAAMQRLDEILSVEPSIADREDVEPVTSLRGEIEFRNLSFSYDASAREPALRDVSLRVPAGSTLGVVGPVGSGKSSLASVIPRLFEVDDGMVFLDGVDVKRIPLHTLRSAIAMVPQESFLFSMSLADNVAYGLPETDMAAVERAAERAQLHKDVADLPAGYRTLVGERGVMLSGGQRQRTALARALALDPSILILDDTLASVDAETEAAIQSQLARVFAGRTVVIVASRVSSVQDCDQIAVLDAGRLVELGTHDQLLAAGGLYARLAREQERERVRAEELDHIGDVA